MTNDPFTRPDPIYRPAKPLPLVLGEVAETGRVVVSGVVWFSLLLLGGLMMWVVM